MATKSPLRLAALSLRPRALHQTTTTTTKRTFLSSFLADNDKPLHIHVSRTLPYPRPQLYELIADVDSYSRFLPYCKYSRVTAWTSLPAGQEVVNSHTAATETETKTRKWPSAGELSLGWGLVDYTYTSRIVCVPGYVVEAHSGDDEPLCRQAGEQREYNNLFRKLSTRWALRDVEETSNITTNSKKKGTIVDLSISMTLRDAMKQAVLSQMVDVLAAEMIQAFEQRAKQMYGSE